MRFLRNYRAFLRRHLWVIKVQSIGVGVATTIVAYVVTEGL